MEIQKKREKGNRSPAKKAEERMSWMASFQGSNERQLLFLPINRNFAYTISFIFAHRAFSPLVKDKPSILATLNSISLYLNNCKLPF